jgi:hypothetical protein
MSLITTPSTVENSTIKPQYSQDSLSVNKPQKTEEYGVQVTEDLIFSFSILLAPSPNDPLPSTPKKVACIVLKGLQGLDFIIQTKKQGMSLLGTLTVATSVGALFQSNKGNIYIQSTLDTLSTLSTCATGMQILNKARPYLRRFLGNTAEKVILGASSVFALYKLGQTFSESKNRRWEEYSLDQMELALNNDDLNEER